MGIFLDHIGIAIQKNSPLIKLFEVLGLPVDATEVVPEEKVKVHFVPLPKGKARVELLEGVEPESKITKFLEKRKKDGVHHLCFRVDDLDLVSQKIRALGFSLVYDQPGKGAGGCKVNFIHPKTTGGILIELSSAPAD